MGRRQIRCLRETNDCVRATFGEDSSVWRTSSWNPFDLGDDTLRVDNFFASLGHFVTCI